MPTIVRTKITVNRAPKNKNVIGFPREKSRFRFFDDWTPRAAAHMLRATSIKDNLFSDSWWLSSMLDLVVNPFTIPSMKH